jgi:hypothetical protein
MASAAEIADLITAGMQGPTGADDSGWHVGQIVSWSSSTGLNSVKIQGATLTNLKALTPSIGTEYAPGQTVLVVRKQTQYFILGPVTTPGAVGSTPPTQVDASGGNLSGTTGTWRDLDAGGSSPTVNVKLGPFQRCLFMWGVGNLWSINYEVEVGIQIVSPGGLNIMATPGTVSGSSFRFGQGISSTQAIRGSGFKTFLGQAASADATASANAIMPGVNAVSLKYKLSTNGTGQLTVGNPWILAIPF